MFQSHTSQSQASPFQKHIQWSIKTLNNSYDHMRKHLKRIFFYHAIDQQEPGEKV